jgi:hypothetical protein
MESIKLRWQKLPSKVRKPIIFVVGMLFIITAALTGWLPGPGGIPLFLIGIAILATEFEWANRHRVRVISWIHKAGSQFRQHKVLGSVVLVICTGIVVTLSIVLYRLWR